MKQLSVNIHPAPNNFENFQNLNYSSKRGIYKADNYSEYPYYLFLGNALYHIERDNSLRYSVDTSTMMKSSLFKYAFVTDEYSVKNNKISFNIPEIHLKLKDNPPLPGTVVQLQIGSKFNDDIFVVPRRKEDHPVIFRDGSMNYSVFSWGEWCNDNYIYRIIGKVF